MKPLLRLTQYIDALNDRVAVIAAYLVLLACVVSGANATIRYALSRGSNAWLELQWYMFAGIVMFGTAKVLRVNEHVRVDIIYGGRSSRTKATIDLLGLVLVSCSDVASDDLPVVAVCSRLVRVGGNVEQQLAG